jgi:citrate synthase
MTSIRGQAPGGGWVTTSEAARRLSIKPATLYAYVSRGVIARRRDDEGRSLFDPAELDVLARRGRPRRNNSGQNMIVNSAITHLREGRPFYRGRDATQLAQSWSLERTAEWLWNTDRPDLEHSGGWTTSDESRTICRAVLAALPDDVRPIERLQIIVTTLAAIDPTQRALTPAAVTAAGRRFMAGMVDCLPGPDVPGPLATRLSAKLSRVREPGLADATRTALVLLADHEMAPSTLASRVAASVRADPCAVVMAGIGVLGGRLHGGASLAAEDLLAQARSRQDPGRVVVDHIRRTGRVPGFGHPVYDREDRRAGCLLDALRAASPANPGLAVGEAIMTECKRHGQPAPTVDFALAVLTATAGMERGAGEVLFAVARTAGWIAHALEEYADPTLPRMRAFYAGGPSAVRSPRSLATGTA